MYIVVIKSFDRSIFNIINSKSTIPNDIQEKIKEYSRLMAGNLSFFEELDPIDEETQREGAYVEMPYLTIDELRAIENPTPSGKVMIEVWLDSQGAAVSQPNRMVKVFYDHIDSEWKYMHDFSLVFP